MDHKSEQAGGRHGMYCRKGSGRMGHTKHLPAHCARKGSPKDVRTQRLLFVAKRGSTGAIRLQETRGCIEMIRMYRKLERGREINSLHPGASRPAYRSSACRAPPSAASDVSCGARCASWKPYAGHLPPGHLRRRHPLGDREDQRPSP